MALTRNVQNTLKAKKTFIKINTYSVQENSQLVIDSTPSHVVNKRWSNNEMSASPSTSDQHTNMDKEAFARNGLNGRKGEHSLLFLRSLGLGGLFNALDLSLSCTHSQYLCSSGVSSGTIIS